MKAWPIRGGADDADAFLEVERDEPELRSRDLLVRVHAVSVNPVDTKVRAGLAAGEVRQLGYDAAGVVEAVGPDVTRFAVGDEVYYAGDISRDGTNAELHAVDERIVGHKPSTASWAEAAALPLTAITAWESLFDHMRLTPDSNGALLVVAAAGGVGSIAVQLVKALVPCVQIIATAGRDESRTWLRSLHVEHLIGRQQLVADVRAAAPDGPRWILSPNTRGNIDAYADLLQTFGTVVALDEPDGLDTLALKAKSAALHWENMFARIVRQASDVEEQGRLLDQVSRLIDNGNLRSTLTRALDGPVPDALQAAHQWVGSGQAVGKVAIETR